VSRSPQLKLVVVVVGLVVTVRDLLLVRALLVCSGDEVEAELPAQW
jgi:hypothetical protein